MLILWFRCLGRSIVEIAELADCSENTARHAMDLFSEGGVVAVETVQVAAHPSSLEPFREQLVEEFTARPVRSVNEARETVARLTGVALQTDAIREFLYSLGMKWRKVGAVPSKADPDQQEEFKKKDLEPRLDEARRGKRQVFFVDAAHFVFGNFLGFLWSMTRLFVPTGSGRQRFNVLGAVDVIGMKLVTVCNLDYVNSFTVCDLLDKIAAQATGPVTLVMDNARYQRNAWVMDHAAAVGIELLFLPTYSPNLNLIERLWKWVKKKCLAARVLGDFDAFRSAIENCLDQQFNESTEELLSLLTTNFQSFKDLQIMGR